MCSLSYVCMYVCTLGCRILTVSMYVCMQGERSNGSLRAQGGVVLEPGHLHLRLQRVHEHHRHLAARLRFLPLQR